MYSPHGHHTARTAFPDFARGTAGAFYTLQHPYDISNFFDTSDSEDEEDNLDEEVIMIMRASVVQLHYETAITVPVASKWH